MPKWSKGPTISAPRTVSKEAECGFLMAVKSYLTASNKGLLVALSRTDSPCLLWSSMGISIPGVIQSKTPTSVRGWWQRSCLEDARKKAKTETLGGTLSPGILNVLPPCNEKNSTKVCPWEGSHPWFWQIWKQPFCFLFLLCSLSEHTPCPGRKGRNANLSDTPAHPLPPCTVLLWIF